MNAQEAAWSGKFGDEYTERNRRSAESDLAFWSRVLSRTGHLGSVIELGAGSGANLAAIKALSPRTELSGVELNPSAFMGLLKVADRGAVCSSVSDWTPRGAHRLAFTKGFLIHVPPSELADVYSKLYASSSRFIMVAEYYNPTPVEVRYREQEGLMWKRDFAGELLDRYTDLRLVDYGFVWRRDAFPQDDVTWFLLEHT